MQQAARFLYLQRLAFGGKVTDTRTFGVAPGLGGRFDIAKLVPMLEDLHERVTGVIVEQLDCEKEEDRRRICFDAAFDQRAISLK